MEQPLPRVSAKAGPRAAGTYRAARRNLARQLAKLGTPEALQQIEALRFPMPKGCRLMRVAVTAELAKGALLRQIRAAKGVGRPLAVPTAPTFASAVKFHGGQRAAARALGLNLSTFQRRLKREEQDAEPSKLRALPAVAGMRGGSVLVRTSRGAARAR